jgi:membrane protein required for colicin V production
MNSFDFVVILGAVVAIVMGFRSGLLRSVATIVGYLCAMPIALVTAPASGAFLTEQLRMPPAPGWAVFCGIFLVTGIVLAALLRTAINELVGEIVSIPDRVAGATLGAMRIGLLAVLMVVIFERIIPPDRQPSFLKESRLRPILSAAGQLGLKSLPPDVAETIDRLKRERGISG